MTPEGKVKQAVKKVLDARPKDVWYFMPVSGGYGRHGIPDFVCCVRGMPGGWFFTIECKSGDGRLTDLQKLTMSAINNVGGYCIVITPKDNVNVVNVCIDMLSSR